MTESKTSPRKLTALERENKSLELRLTGATYQQIGDALGFTKQAAYNAVIRAIGKLNDKIMENAEQVKSLELQRLDKLYTTMYRRALQGEYGAVDRCLRIMERRAKYHGLDAPIKQDLTSYGEKLEIGVNVVDYRNAIAPVAPGSIPDSSTSSENESSGDGEKVGQDGIGRRSDDERT